VAATLSFCNSSGKQLMNIFHIRDKNVFVNIDTIKGVAKLDNLRKEKYTKIYFLFDLSLFLLCVIFLYRMMGYIAESREWM